MTITTDTIRKVWEDGEGVYVQVAPDGDALGLVHVTTLDDSISFFGACDLVMNTTYAKALATAILRTCQDIEENAK